MTNIPHNPSEPHVVAALDVGSTAIRLLVAEIDDDGNVRILENLQRSVSLGQDAFATSHLEQETINQAIEIIRGFQTIMQPYEVRELHAVATSAVREATNQDVFLDRVYMATGISIEVVSGSEEHRILYRAVRQAYQADKIKQADCTLILELGAGTAELAMFEENRVAFSGSYPFGTVRLTTALHTAHRTPSETVELLRRHIGPSLDVIEHGSPLRDMEEFIAVGSEMRFVANHLCGHKGAAKVQSIPRKKFKKFLDEVSEFRPEEIASEYDLQYPENETLLPAMLTYWEIFSRTRAKQICVPFVSMRDGLILDFIADKTDEGSEELEAQIVSSAESLGERYQYEDEHSHHVTKLALMLFDQTQSEHNLDRFGRRILRIAGLLHDIGNFISSRAHHKHSAYIIRYSDLFGLRSRDRDLVATVARYHRRALPKMTHVEYMNLVRSDRALVSKISAILRVADALDCGHSKKIKNFEVELTSMEMIIHTQTREDLTLERQAMRVKGNMFEEVFGRKVILQN